ncbi:unnamed protein product, partial [marine sediment metagenome]
MGAKAAGFLLVVLPVLPLLLGGCGGGGASSEPSLVGVSSQSETAVPLSDKATSYAFDALDEREVSSESMRGKPSVIVFVATGDLAGQAQLSYIVHMAKNDGERVNYAVVALHPRKEIVLVEAYRKTLGVEFPVALGEGRIQA